MSQEIEAHNQESATYLTFEKRFAFVMIVHTMSCLPGSPPWNVERESPNGKVRIHYDSTHYMAHFITNLLELPMNLHVYPIPWSQCSDSCYKHANNLPTQNTEIYGQLYQTLENWSLPSERSAFIH